MDIVPNQVSLAAALLRELAPLMTNETIETKNAWRACLEAVQALRLHLEHERIRQKVSPD
jgi:hypothetical protein